MILTSAAKNVESFENNFVEESIKSAEEHLNNSNISDKERYLISNKIDVLIRGKRAPQIGNICMDMTLIDVTKIKGVEEGDEVNLNACTSRQANTIRT